MTTTNNFPAVRNPQVLRWLSQLPSSTNSDHIHTKMEGGDDPWDWLIDKVVQEFCTGQRSWELRAASNRLPDPVYLEKIIRDNEITGDVLLVDLDDRTLRDDLQVAKLGWRSFIRYGIEQLRLRSPKYQNLLIKERSLASSAPIPQQYSNSLRSLSSLGDFSFTINSAVPINMPSGVSGNQNSPVPALQPLRLLTEKEAEGQNSSLNEAIEDGSVISRDNKRRRLVSENPVENSDRQLENNHLEPLFLTPSVSPSHSLIQQDNTQSEQIPAGTSDHASDKVQPTKKRKRISPTLVTTAIDQGRDRTIYTEADTVRIYRHSQLDHGYLGNSKIPVDDVFYGSVAVGEQIPSGEIVLQFQERRAISSGRRQYINGLMKHFLRANPEFFERNEQSLMAVKPYHLRFAQKASFTLYCSGSNKNIKVTRQALSLWPEINPEASPLSLHTGKSTFNFDSNVEGDLLANAYDDPGALDKYNMLRDDDEELPLYGESGSENGVDTETWEAIAEEAKERAAYMEKKREKNRFLTPQEVEIAVDAGIADLVSQWKEIKLPKRRQRAFRLWTKSRRTGSKHADILKAQQELKHLVDSRIPKLRENIILGQWSNSHQVRHQTRIMEATIFDREDLVYTITLLQTKSPPPKLATDIPVKARKTILLRSDSDSGESIHSESSAVESVDDIGDFVVEELSLADGEDDTTMSDDSFPEAPVTSSRGAAKPISKTGSSVQHSYDSEGDNNMGSLSHDEELESPQPIPTEHSSLKARSESAVSISTSTPTKTTTVIDLMTPEKNEVSKLKLNFGSSSLVNPIVLSSESDQEQHIQRLFLDPNDLPSLKTPAAVSRHGYKTWEDFGDQDRLIVSVVDKLSNFLQKSLFELMGTMNDVTELQTHIEESIDLENQTKGLDGQLSMALLTLVRLFWIFVDCKFHSADGAWMHIAAGVIRNDNFSSLDHFYKLCRSLENYFNPRIRLKLPKAEFPLEYTAISDDEEDDEPQTSAKRKRRPFSIYDSDQSSEYDQENSQSKKQRKIFEDAGARDLREQDRARVAAQEERKKQLRARLEESDNVGDVRLDRHIINEGKFDDQGYIYVDEEIGKRIKPHQLDGVRFIWNQITADGKATQGCLLAHTMGLGKTMQTLVSPILSCHARLIISRITILVALAQAASSTDVSVSSQVPKSLRVSRTIILCPPGLIANWVDELLTWSPDDILGDLRPIESASTPASRFRTINDWFHEGGILLIGYEMFRSLASGPKQSDQPMTPLDKKLKLARTQLLEGPNIVVADEAHKMKNHKSALCVAASKFRSRTRIALTGSPLANNVEEYHTMVEWVAPNYLGPIAEFRAKYKEPIEQGLYFNSTPYEKRKGMKMLDVLKEDLSPKVHRADTSVLRDDLPPKKEFIINVSLTQLQKQAYITYVRSVSSQKPTRTKSGDLKQTTLWAYLNILTLLCNHPSCFKAKLDEVHRSSQADSRFALKSRQVQPMESLDVTDEDLEIEIDPESWKVGISEDLISAEAKVFKSFSGEITNPELSNKVKILCQILDASKAIGDKVLVFSQTLATLNFLETMCKEQGRRFARLDGKTPMKKRQTLVKDFNSNDLELYLISTTAGGLGLNLYGANRVVIFDFRYNPINEEQAIGRAYRIGQKKHVFVYRLMSAGTFEGSIQNKAVFKTQLASRVVDKKSPMSWAQKGLGEILFEPKELQQEDLSAFEGMDSAVLDNILNVEENKGTIVKIIQSDDFEKDDDDRLTPKEKEEVRRMVKDEQLKRSDPQGYRLLMQKRENGVLPEITGRQQAQQIHQPQTPSIIENEMVHANKSRKNPDDKDDNSDVKLLSPGQNAKMLFFNRLKIIARNTDGFPYEDSFLQTKIGISKSIDTFYSNSELEWNDERQRIVYQRAKAFILSHDAIAQQLLSRKLTAWDFLPQVSSWWNETRSGLTSVHGQQPQNSTQVNSSALQPVAPLANNGYDKVTDNDAGVESVVPSKSHLLTAQSSMIVEGSNAPNPKSGEHMENANIPGHQSSQQIESREQDSSSQGSIEDIPERRPNGSLSEVIQNSATPTVIIANKPDGDELERIADNQPIGKVALNDSVEATANSSVKVDRSDSSLSDASSPSDETRMFRAMNREPRSLRTPVSSHSKNEKKQNPGSMRTEDREMLRLVRQRRLDREQTQNLLNSSHLKPMRAFPRSSEGV
ncbi:hypothetical protein DSL72_000063 [Monilinia vaccinii-corymbosi]|uniref:Uncharacterized protein n=1 Tax=Monilinia vaccinii-corymbosi TaxID=61207 RepID=A0A8A3P997_9HELO|nr:hypothetical protein DSL72_000063 [Monilinia vaccinii-corymbosi]